MGFTPRFWMKNISSLCHSATKIGNFTIRQFSNRQKPIGKLTKRQSYKSATLPFGKSTIKQRGHSATLPNGNLTIRQLNKIANLLFGNFFNILAASKNVVEDLDSRWKWSAQDIRSSAQNKRSKTERACPRSNPKKIKKIKKNNPP